MSLLITFIIGILFVQVGIPILDDFTSLFATWVECIKGRYSVKIAEYNKQIRLLGKENDDALVEEKQLIGFVMEEEDTEDEKD